MTRPCGCGGNAINDCNCVIVPGPNTSITGTGTAEDPYVITGSVTQLQVADTSTVDLTLAGDGAATPYQLSGQVRVDPSASNLIDVTASGLLVACGSVQDCVAEAMGPGLAWDATNRQFGVDLSTEPGNILTVDDAGALYASADGSVVPAQPRARIGKATAQQGVPTGGAITTLVQFDTPITDNAGMFTVPGRLTAPVDGGYTVGVQIQWQNVGANNTGHRAVFLRLNGTTLIGGDQRDAARTVSTIQNVNISRDMVAGDYVEVLVQHTHPTAIALLAAPDFVPVMWMYLGTEGAG